MGRTRPASLLGTRRIGGFIRRPLPCPTTNTCVARSAESRRTRFGNSFPARPSTSATNALLCNEIIAEDEEREVAEAITRSRHRRRSRMFGPIRIGQEKPRKRCRSRSIPLQAHQFRVGPGRVELINRTSCDRPNRRRKDAVGQTLARILDVALHDRRRHDAHRSGVRGEDVENIWFGAPGRRFQRRGMRARLVYIDEIDKIARSRRIQASRATFPGRECKQALLKISRHRRVGALPRGAQASQQETSRSTPTGILLSAAAHSMVGKDHRSSNWAASDRLCRSRGRQDGERKRTRSPKSSRTICCVMV